MKTESETFVPRKGYFEDFLSSFYYELLKGQRASSLGIFIIAVFVSTIWTCLWLFFQEPVNQAMGFPFPAVEIAISFYGIAIYELIYTFFITQCIRHRKRLWKGAIYFNAFIEGSFATIVICVLAIQLPSPIIPFFSPALVAYFIFIILSVLKLDFFVSLFTGLVAAVGYVASFLYFIREGGEDIVITFFNSHFAAIIRGVIIFVSGIVTGFAAHQLRKRIYFSMQSLSEKNAIVSMFGQYISPVVVERLIHQKSVFPPELHHVCVIFFDIRNFTAFTEKHTPNEVIDFLNRFFLPLIEITNAHHGFINKFLGDGFLAVFGAPIPDGEDVQHATNAAFAMLQKIEEMVQSGEIPPTRCGIGLDAGMAMTGNVGSEERKEYTVIGNTVNLASRVEQLNKEFGSQLIVTKDVYKFIEQTHPALKKATVTIRGKTGETEVFVLA